MEVLSGGSGIGRNGGRGPVVLATDASKRWATATIGGRSNLEETMDRQGCKPLASLVLIVALVVGVQSAAAQPALASGALGVTRAEFEATFGRPSEEIDAPGHPIYDESYAHENEDGTLFVTYREINGEAIAVYLEFAWRGNGASAQAARAVAAGLLPTDAELTEIYVAPPTRSGPVALVTHRYESDALGAVQTLAPEILVIYQERWGDDAQADSTRVEAISIVTRERTQATG